MHARPAYRTTANDLTAGMEQLVAHEPHKLETTPFESESCYCCCPIHYQPERYGEHMKQKLLNVIKNPTVPKAVVGLVVAILAALGLNLGSSSTPVVPAPTTVEVTQ